MRIADPYLLEEIAELEAAPALAPATLPRHQLQLGDRCVYFFKQDHYVRYRVATEVLPDGREVPFEAVDVGPAPISRFWTHLHPFFHRDIDAVVNWGNGKVYFFKQDHYARYDIATDLIDVGPAPISRFWTHLHPSFHRDIGAVLNWTGPMDIAAYLRSAGLVVNEIGDWRSRVRPGGGSFTPVGVVMHHTATANSLGSIVRGRPDLAGPLANFHVPKSGVLNLVSGNIANHAGFGSRQVLFEVTHDLPMRGNAVARGLHNDKTGNPFFYGFENENLGNGRDPWPDEQLRTMAKGAAGLCRAHCWTANRVIAHREWRSGKIDPAGIDMDAFRDHARDELG